MEQSTIVSYKAPVSSVTPHFVHASFLFMPHFRSSFILAALVLHLSIKSPHMSVISGSTFKPELIKNKSTMQVSNYLQAARRGFHGKECDLLQELGATSLAKVISELRQRKNQNWLAWGRGVKENSRKLGKHIQRLCGRNRTEWRWINHGRTVLAES